MKEVLTPEEFAKKHAGSKNVKSVRFLVRAGAPPKVEVEIEERKQEKRQQRSR